MVHMIPRLLMNHFGSKPQPQFQSQSQPAQELDPQIAKLLQLQTQPEEAQPLLPPKIQNVPVFLRRKNHNFVKYCSPKMISFGPIHHHLDDTDLKLGQQFKTRWAHLYLEQFKRRKEQQNQNDDRHKNDPKVSLYETITRKIPTMRNLFSQDVIKDYNDRKLADMLFVDGCALLYFMDNVDEQHPEKLTLKLDQLMYIWRDIILLENQLPMELLELLSDKPMSELTKLFFKFLFMCLTRRNQEDSNELKPAHLLDYIRLFHTFGSSLSPQVKPSLLDRSISFMYAMISRLFKKEETLPLSWHRYKNIRDLRNVGIRVEANKTSEWKWSNVSFTSKLFSGKLMLPGIVVDDVAPYFYHNMIAYEMLPDFPNNYEFCSYFSLMDSFIDDAEDVKELRVAGVLQNMLGSDEEVAKLFNELKGVLPAKMFNYSSSVVGYSNKYIQIKEQIDKHYGNKWKTCWLAQLRSTYFNTPWSCIAFLAAVLALLLTSIQTWYTVNPKQNS
ncbi:hypothetical protein HN51_021536 [Arachis hypogaea]|uniref:UPF0481 protein At3g47200-like n=1 Tax=Arachis hypogaea TaxID=3818 RepID=UPI000DECC9C6|nr:UPF0481 protein At3g47200-like [Arachis hypogaea]QHO52631.1 UPF0481 protein [Arachis hypogaea]